MKQYIKLFAILLLCLCMAEVIVRYAVRAPAAEYYEELAGAYAALPHAQMLRTDEGYSRFVLDENGFNNDTLFKVLPSKRVLFLGDSFVYALQVMRSNNFISLLQKRLGKDDVLLYNGGAQGLDPSFFPAYYQRLNKKIMPQSVVLCLSNDDVGNLLRWGVKRDEDGQIIAFLRGNHAPDQFGRIRGWLYAHSALITHLKFRFDAPVRRWVQEKQAWFSSVQDVAAPLTHEQEMDQALARWRFVLRYFIQRHLTLTVLLMPALEDKSGGSPVLVYNGIDFLAKEAAKMGIPVLNGSVPLLSDFRKSKQPGKGFSNSTPGIGHLNQRGHKLLADWLLMQKEVLLR